jgi:hypothetical protein
MYRSIRKSLQEIKKENCWKKEEIGDAPLIDPYKTQMMVKRRRIS